MGLHYVIFKGRNLENMKKLMPVRKINNAGVNSKNIVNSLGIFNDIDLINSISFEQYKDRECFMQVVMG